MRKDNQQNRNYHCLQALLTTKNGPTIQDLIVDPGYPASPEPSVTPHLKTKEQNRVRSERLEIVGDMCIRLTKQNPTYNSGVRTFIHQYKALKQKTISTPCLASALHMFGSEGELTLAEVNIVAFHCIRY